MNCGILLWISFISLKISENIYDLLERTASKVLFEVLLNVRIKVRKSSNLSNLTIGNPVFFEKKLSQIFSCL